MVKKLRVGVVGVGYLGRFHALIYSRMANVELVGVVDTSAIRAAEVATEAGTHPLSLDALCDQVDAVSIVVPTTLHLEIARPFLERGVHMLLEKPIAANVADADAIIALAAASGAILQIGHLERYNAGIVELASRITNPRFIDAQRMGGFKERATDVDVISDLMIHDIDIILSLIQSELVGIHASGTSVITNHIDIANARLEFANGAAANVTASRVSREDSRRIRVFEPSQYLSLDFIAQKLDIATAAVQPDNSWPKIVSESVALTPVRPLDDELANFIHTVEQQGTPLVSGQTGRLALDVALQIHQKIHS
jgi:predicted dehydrogenase